MRAGFGKAGVNPPLGMAMEGLGQAEGCRSIHDDLFVRALYLKQGDKQVLVVGCDLLFFERATIDRFKRALDLHYGLDPSVVLLNVSHNHAGPRLTTWNYSPGADARYLDAIERALLKATRTAMESAVEVTMRAGTTETNLPVSRRKPGTDGKVEWAPCPEAEVCTALPFVILESREAGVISVLFSVSCHPSMIYTPDISAEYPGAAVRALNAHFKTEGSLFLQGAGGDTKPRPIAVGAERWRHGTWEEMEEAGLSVAQAVIRASDSASKVVPELRAYSEITRWPLLEAPAKAEFERILADPQERESRKAWASQMADWIEAGTAPGHVPVEVAAVQIGRGVRLIGVEGELVGELGNQILARYDRGVTFPLGYTNGCRIYLPSTRMLAGHGYEVDSYWEYHYPAPLAPETDVTLASALRRMQESGRMPNEPVE